MGDVWLAHDLLLDIDVALKVLRVDHKHSERRGKLTQRLLQEARAAAKLGHPAIVRITDFGELPSGNGFFVMELLEGEDLFTFLDRHGRLSAVKAVRTLLPIAHALVAAHAKRIVHRDLKPENIYLARDASGNVIQPKLIDFGVAKLQRAANERLTASGAVLGSPGYMAPEQARGEDVDERADIWGLSVVLYEAMTGRLPFEGKNYNALMRSIIEDRPPPISTFGVGDHALSTIVALGLEKDPDRRWQSMKEFGTALAGWLLERQVTEDICGAHLGTIWVRGGLKSDLARSSAPPASREFQDRASSPARLTRRHRADANTLPEAPDPVAPVPRHAARAKVAIAALVSIVVVVLALGALRSPDAVERAERRSQASSEALIAGPGMVAKSPASAIVDEPKFDARSVTTVEVPRDSVAVPSKVSRVTGERPRTQPPRLKNPFQ